MRGGGRVHFKNGGFLWRPSSLRPGNAMGSSEATTFTQIAAIRQQAGIEGICLVGEIVFEEKAKRVSPSPR